jgi:hypothetical protein
MNGKRALTFLLPMVVPKRARVRQFLDDQNTFPFALKKRKINRVLR